MLKYRVSPRPEYDGSVVAFIYKGNKEYVRVLDKNPNKAICLAIIELFDK